MFAINKFDFLLATSYNLKKREKRIYRNTNNRKFSLSQ